MTINNPDMLVSFEAVSFPYGQDVDTHQLAVQRAPNLADAPIYAVTVDITARCTSSAVVTQLI